MTYCMRITAPDTEVLQRTRPQENQVPIAIDKVQNLDGRPTCRPYVPDLRASGIKRLHRGAKFERVLHLGEPRMLRR